MADRVATHYSENLELAGTIAETLRSAGKDPKKLTTADLAIVDEFHIRGLKATLELGEKMSLNARSDVLDIGSGLGGPARTLAETYDCRLTGIDLTQAFCDAATTMSNWVGLDTRVSFKQGEVAVQNCYLAGPSAPKSNLGSGVAREKALNQQSPIFATFYFDQKTNGCLAHGSMTFQKPACPKHRYGHDFRR